MDAIIQALIQALGDYSKEVQWLATLTGIGAAAVVSLNLGPRITGYAFIVFTVSSLSWITVALLQDETPLLIQNIVLTVINIIGVYRWLWLRAGDDGDSAVAAE